MKAQDLIGFFSKFDYKTLGAGIALISSLILNVTQFIQMKDDGARKDRELEIREVEIATLKKKVDKGNEIKEEDRNETNRSIRESRLRLEALERRISELEWRRDNILRNQGDSKKNASAQDHASISLLDEVKADLANARSQVSSERDRLVSLGKILKCGDN
ncbi:hypothetical protein KAK06_17250 [Ideonella sp. 4Y11]|uniref:Uncharacterized protein n=1 Tax=Ideonella aquatica TaxID=2824119 RepID=A0A941BRQ5_9BURK|nr:hypothetical protein [Ideonella aquatica]MBQ0960705.1 hypothetical protein [Ideonella aquatica]